LPQVRLNGIPEVELSPQYQLRKTNESFLETITYNLALSLSSGVDAIISGRRDIVWIPVGLDMEKIKAYVQYQDAKDKLYEQRQLGP